MDGRKLTVRKAGAMTGYYIYREGDKTPFAHFDDEADAHLFTQADALLSVLREVLYQIEDAELHGGGAHDDGCSICLAMQDGWAAIAKARGVGR